MEKKFSDFFKRKKFISELRTGVQTEQVQQIVLNDKVYTLDMRNIDRKIEVSKPTKKGQQLYLYRNGVTSKQIQGHCFVRSQYFIINSNGKVIGRIPVSINSPYSASIDYWISEEQRGKGIGTVALEEVIKQIYENREFDNLEFSSIMHTDTDRTNIKNINLEINDDNDASKRIAIKNGFKKDGERSYSLTIEEYNSRKQEKLDAIINTRGYTHSREHMKQPNVTPKKIAEMDKIEMLMETDLAPLENSGFKKWLQNAKETLKKLFKVK